MTAERNSTMTDNRALWEMVDSLRESANVDWSTSKNKDWAEWVRDRANGSAAGKCYAADAIQAILEHPVVVGDSEVRLWDTQWMNIVNHDNCYREWSKEDAIAHAVKMTEESIARNVADGKLPQRKDALESMVRGKS